MNNAKLWLVVKPTVGIPLFLGAVAVGSFAVHVGVVLNTGWVGDFFQGKPLGSTAAAREAAVNEAAAAAVAKAAYVTPDVNGERVVVILPDGSTASAVLATARTDGARVVEH